MSAQLALGKTHVVNGSICIFLSVSGTVFLVQVQYTTVVDLDPLAWFIPEFVAANTGSMVLFVGSPTYTVIFEGSRVNKMVFLVRCTSTVTG